MKHFNISFLTVIAALFLSVQLTAQVTAIVTGTNVTCFGANNGYAHVQGSGGWQPYTYQWSTGATTQTIAGLAPGTYYVTVTDIDLGTAIGSITITQPLQLGVTLYSTGQICSGTPDGTAAAIPYGGTPPYTYLWNTGGTSSQITGLNAGTYTVTVTDQNNCTVVGSVQVLTFGNEGIWIGGDTIDVTCYGLNDGMALAMPMSGTAPYTYLWSTGATTMKITGLAPGAYTVTITDANGCVGTHEFPIEEPPILTATVSTTSALCVSNGTATVTPGGGTPPYSIVWNTGQTTFTISNLAPGTYSATVTDAHLCSKPVTVTVTGSGQGLTVVATANTPAGCTVGGSATAAASGGSGVYTYLWDNGQTTSVATNLTVGNHSVTVIDSQTGCQGTATINIAQATPIITAIVASTNATCSVGGSATVSASGGVAPYTYLWSNGATTATVLNLAAGTYMVTVRDVTNCMAVQQVVIAQTQGPTVTVQVNSQATCTTGGSATATATGGVGPYMYLWNNGQTTATATNLPAGTAIVTVTDVNGCAASAMATIAQGGTPTATVQVNNQATCTTGGKITASATGGVSPYTYTWSNGATTAMIQSLAPGTYTVTVRDANNCSATASATIQTPAVPTVIISASASANCNQPGSATAMAAGGTPSYSYHWSNGELTATAVNLPAGTYTVTVTDSGGCTATTSVTIGQTNNGVSIGDYVWYDNDQDGFQNPLETSGVANVTVMLIKPGPDGLFGTADDITQATTTTNASGYYQFSCVTPGAYILMFSGIPAGYEFTKKDYVNNDCKDSDAKANGKTDPFNVVSGQGNNFCFDAGIHTVCENVTNPGAICCDQTICEGETPAAIYESVAPIGGSGAFQYVWMQLIQIGQAPPNWQPLNAYGQSYQPGPLTETSFFMRCIRRDGCVPFLESNIVTITVLPAGSPGCEGFMTNMSVNPSGSQSVNVNFATGAESEQYMYSVQHSDDAANWSKVADVMGHMNVENQYVVNHDQPVNGVNFYRVMRTDDRNNHLYSEIVSVNMALNDPITIVPNPVTDVMLIRNTDKFDTDIQVDLMTLNGVLLQSMTFPAGELQRLNVSVDHLAAGCYMARVQFGKEVKTIKVVKL